MEETSAWLGALWCTEVLTAQPHLPCTCRLTTLVTGTPFCRKKEEEGFQVREKYQGLPSWGPCWARTAHWTLKCRQGL